MCFYDSDSFNQILKFETPFSAATIVFSLNINSRAKKLLPLSIAGAIKLVKLVIQVFLGTNQYSSNSVKTSCIRKQQHLKIEGLFF